jgi:hypothetical protein
VLTLAPYTMQEKAEAPVWGPGDPSSRYWQYLHGGKSRL